MGHNLKYPGERFMKTKAQQKSMCSCIHIHCVYTKYINRPSLNEMCITSHLN